MFEPSLTSKEQLHYPITAKDCMIGECVFMSYCSRNEMDFVLRLASYSIPPWEHFSAFVLVATFTSDCSVSGVVFINSAINYMLLILLFGNA